MYKNYTSYYLVNFRYNSTLIPIFRNATPNGELAKGDFFAASNSFEIERAMFNRGSGEEIANLLLFGVLNGVIALAEGVTTIVVPPFSSFKRMHRQQWQNVSTHLRQKNAVTTPHK